MVSTTEGRDAKNNSIAPETVTMTHNQGSKLKKAQKRKEIHYEICCLDYERATVHLEKAWRDAYIYVRSW